ncbi:4173_t:CDS:1 [Cetraspora pellucida]|uniref:4173_t:CDS:1 n=1 Tax=Cetraspora pellucida TaxID=1433469 RepID=A0A9N9HJ54_9GLOM|nr:4173_t:CDS:1 [Cetraspora pellucida]
MSFFQTLVLQNIFPPRHNDPNDIINMLHIYFNTQSVTARGAFRFNVYKEAERLGFNNQHEINAVVSKLWSNATILEKEQYKTLATNINALLPRRFPMRTFRRL